MAITVAVLVPADDGDSYLLTLVEGRGWWMPFGTVGADQSIKSAAQRVATAVCVLIFALFTCFG